MRLLRLSEVELTPDERVFAHSRLKAAAFVIALLAGAAGTAAFAFRNNSSILYYIAAVFVLLSMLFRGYVAAHFRPTNWLARTTASGLFIKFRSYLNYRIPDDGPEVVFFAYSEIRSACMVRVQNTVVSTEGGRSTQTLDFVEFELVGDTAPLEKALRAESARPAPPEKRWYGTTSTLYRDYPLSIAAPQFLRVQWSVVPKASVFLDLLRPYTKVTETVLLREDIVSLMGLSRAEQEKRLQELDARGETVTAVYMARRLFGIGITEATKLVERLRTVEVAKT